MTGRKPNKLTKKERLRHKWEKQEEKYKEGRFKLNNPTEYINFKEIDYQILWTFKTRANHMGSKLPIDFKCFICNERPNYGFNCTNGHSVCDTCKPKLQTCPYCRQEIINHKMRVIKTGKHGDKEADPILYKQEEINEMKRMSYLPQN